MAVHFGSIAEQKTIDGRVFPLVISPDESQQGFSQQQFNSWIAQNKSQLHELLISHGALLFRGFPVDDSEAFEVMLDHSDYTNMEYVGGAAPRTQVTKTRVITANEAPASEKIPFHHEMAQVPKPPGYIFFYCDIAAQSGGATSILHSAEIYRAFEAIDPEFAQKIEREGVRYIRVMPEQTDNSSPIGRSWKETFIVDNKEQAEERLKEAGMDWEWLENGDLKTITKTLDAIRFDDEIERKVFFNAMVAVYTGWNDSRNSGETAVVTGSGERLDKSVIEKTKSAMNELCVNFPWQHSDVLWINNHTVLHARQSFEGPRRILASIAIKED
ncbi:hypothetical protein DBZ36_16680 [Alginatibacterium sediminis]|uniref:TauD/TfdA-like domain-containing protein n=1 Tax=Alginatibacterium sediminis TaxID=2164068 RepID=A0A420E7C7_9ALTE|nr:TauD/TfdA family dioxygenase [Alginatibacterium sediminis]RKF14299.1 hypothetical protein DBZ36_16680 [Alginatibacterium sediminis]